MKKLMKRFHYGEKGFTLIELLIVVAILGVLAAVLAINLGGFLSTGQAAAANTEVANVETAALAYYADNDEWPTDTNTDLLGGNYTSKAANVDYGFDIWGKVDISDGTVWPPDNSVTWVLADHKWSK
jgi:prepilin-type N-terminal cleavage/methylation domain-containing protein